MYALTYFAVKFNRIASSLGYDLCIGVAIVKTWRVVYIVKFPKPNKKVRKSLLCLTSLCV